MIPAGIMHARASPQLPPVPSRSRMSDSLDILRRVFGYPSFRGPQEEIIDHLTGGGDALVLMPTGGGKSLCYQIPSILRPGVGVVVSPLIALMQDQVDALLQAGVRAAFLNSSQDFAAAFAIKRRLPRSELVEHAREREDVRATVDVLERELLWCHVPNLAAEIFVGFSLKE